MLKNIRELLYAEDGIMNKIRDGDKITEHEEELILEFSKNVNKHIKEGNIEIKEFLICLEMVEIFNVYEEETGELATLVYENVVEGIDFY